jgi:hypothetical protein
MSSAPSATQRLRQSLTAQLNPATLAEIQTRIAPAGDRPDGAQMAAVLMFKNMAATLQIANIKRATADTQSAKNARRLSKLNPTK